MTALICVWKPRISSYYHTCRGRKCHWAVGRSVAWRHFKGTCDRAGLLAFFFRIYANQKPRKKNPRLWSQFREAWVWCASTRTQARPRNWAQIRCPRTRSESPSQPLGPESRNTPRPHESVSIRHTFLKFLFHCFAVCQLVPMSSSFYCLLLYTLHQSQENPYRPVTRRVIMKRDGRYSKENLGKQQ